MANQKMYDMPFAKIYPMLIAKAEKKGRARENVDEITCWMTGYKKEALDELAKGKPMGKILRT